MGNRKAELQEKGKGKAKRPRFVSSELQDIDARFQSDVELVFDYQRSVEQRTSIGGTSKSAVRQQIEILKSGLAAV